jgi:hypothetical protein
MATVFDFETGMPANLDIRVLDWLLYTLPDVIFPLSKTWEFFSLPSSVVDICGLITDWVAALFSVGTEGVTLFEVWVSSTLSK